MHCEYSGHASVRLISHRRLASRQRCGDEADARRVRELVRRVLLVGLVRRVTLGGPSWGLSTAALLEADQFPVDATCGASNGVTPALGKDFAKLWEMPPQRPSR